MSSFVVGALGQRRCLSVFARASANLGASLPKRITSKHNQKTLGSYPFPPEHEMLWKNRRAIPGGYFHQAISPFQLKFCYPLIHQAYARYVSYYLRIYRSMTSFVPLISLSLLPRLWAKTSQMFWWVIWPFCMAIVGYISIESCNEKYLKRLHYD